MTACSQWMSPSTTAGRIVLPKRFRERLGLVTGANVDIWLYGDGLHIVPTGRAARIEQHDGHWVPVTDTSTTDDDIFDLVDSIRR